MTADTDEPGEPIDPLRALFGAAVSGDVDALRDVLDTHPHLVSERGTLRGHTGMRTALHFAMSGPHEDIVTLLLERGANPNVRDDGDNAFPLHFAAEKEHISVISELVEHGADTIGRGDTHQLDVIGWATVFGGGTQEVVNYLLEHGAQHNIFSAVATGDLEVIRDIVTATPEALDARMVAPHAQRTPLHLAVAKKQAEALSLLITLGAALDVYDIAGLTPLDLAALQREQDLADMLVYAGARVELPAAVALERIDVMEQILGDDPTLLHPGNRYGSLLVQASERSPGLVIDMLVEAGASVNEPAKPEISVDGAVGYTALHAAAFHGNISAIEALLDAGADARARDERYGGTPAGWARFAGHAEACQTVLGGDIDIFDAVEFNLSERLADIVERDPGALTRPFGTYVNCEGREDAEYFNPDKTPLDVAIAEGHEEAETVLRDLAADSDQT